MWPVTYLLVYLLD